MKIGIVTPRFAPYVGGVQLHVEHIARHAAAAGHEVEVLTETPDRSAGNESLSGVLIRRFPVAVDSMHYSFSAPLWRYLRRHGRRYDIVHAHNYHSLAALAPAVVSDTPLVLTPHYHGTSASSFRRALHRPYRAAGRHLLRRSRRVICVSGREQRLLEQHFPSVAGRVTVIPNGVDVEPIRAARPFAQSETLVLSAGRLEEYKGVDRIIEAMTYLGPQHDLVVTGDGPERPKLEAQIRRLKLEDRVRLLGRVPVDELHRWFRTADVYVTASAIEAMPLTPLEVLAAGARVVASDIDAHREVAEATGGRVRLISLEASAAELATEIRAAAAATTTDPSPRVLDWSEVARRTVSVYHEALHLQPSRRPG